MINYRYIILILVASIVVSSCTSSRHSECEMCGEWRWENNDDQHDFSVKISMQDGILIGKHCYIIDHGNKMDCSSEQDVSFKVPYPMTGSAQVDIRSYYSGASGIVEVKLRSGKLYWKLIKAPEEEYYLPKEAVLIKDKAKK